MADVAQGRGAHVAFGVLGTVLLVAACAVTLLVGAFSGFLTDTCSAGDYDAGGPAQCRNAGFMFGLLLGTPLVIGPLVLVWTWRSRRRGKPRGWAPFVGIVVLAAAWVAVSLLIPGQFLF